MPPRGGVALDIGECGPLDQALADTAALARSGTSRSHGDRGFADMAELMAIPFPGIDPVAIALGPVHVRWYGLAYLAGLVLGWLYMRQLLRNAGFGAAPRRMKPEQADDFLLWATLGTVIGGRLGFILLYEPTSFFTSPCASSRFGKAEWLSMAACSGVMLAIILFARLNSCRCSRSATSPLRGGADRAILWQDGEFHQWRGLWPADRRTMGGRVPCPVLDVRATCSARAIRRSSTKPSSKASSCSSSSAFSRIRGIRLNEPGFTAGLFLFGYAIAANWCRIFQAMGL